MLFLIDVGKDIWVPLVKRVAKRSRGVHLSTVNFVDFKFIGMICFAKGVRRGLEMKYNSKRRPPTPWGEEISLVARFHHFIQKQSMGVKYGALT
jgi:hypothetical protein